VSGLPARRLLQRVTGNPRRVGNFHAGLSCDSSQKLVLSCSKGVS